MSHSLRAITSFPSSLSLLRFLSPSLIHSPHRSFSSHRVSSDHYDISIIGGGIVGLACARQFLLSYPHLKVAVVEKETLLATHQSHRNSGVIHAGIYYAPGSQRAELCAEGAERMFAYCKQNQLPHERVGKLIVAVDPSELDRLDMLFERGKLNGVKGLEMKTSQQITQMEPNIRGLRAIWSPNTGIADFQAVAHSYAREFQALGGVIHTNFEVVQAHEEKLGGEVQSITLTSKQKQSVKSSRVLVCGGLYADRLAVLLGGAARPEVVSFRGTWLLLKPQYRSYVRTNVYPVPNPAFPFLGVHLTPSLRDQTILIGPNAALAFAREGYDWTVINPTDLEESLRVEGLQKLIGKHWFFGLNELVGELMPRTFALPNIQKYAPMLDWQHIHTKRLANLSFLPERPIVKSGVRAQAIAQDGKLIEDFVFEEQLSISAPNPSSSFSSSFSSSSTAAAPAARILHVRNAPSPAATSSLAIAERVVKRAAAAFRL